MPQMSPINWLILFIIFSLTFLIFNMMNYYMFKPILPKSIMAKKFLKNSFYWKW